MVRMTGLTARFPDLSGPAPDIRLVVVDMDGTLLDPDHRMPDGLGDLLDRLGERGIAFCPASGRQHATLVRQFDGLLDADRLVVVAENGSYVAAGGREISSVTVDRGVVHDVVRAVRGLAAQGVPVGAVVCGKRSAYVERDDPEFLTETHRYYALLEEVDDLLAVEDEVLKVAVYDAGSAAERTAPALDQFSSTQQVVVSGRHWVDVMDPAVHKGVAVRALQERLGITPEQTMAFGDYLNDLELLDAGGWSFAMANAHPAVCARARFLAPSNADDGVVRTIRAVLRLPA
jgi:Cof subfamily protein (haloacid dehalogenase superfamily)